MSKKRKPRSPATRAYFLFGGIGQRCKSRRAELGRSQDELVRRDNEDVLTLEAIAELEADPLGAPPEALNLDEVAALAWALDMDPRSLLFGDEPSGAYKPVSPRTTRKPRTKAKRRKAKAGGRRPD